jgi:hypothetical protein
MPKVEERRPPEVEATRASVAWLAASTLAIAATMASPARGEDLSITFSPAANVSRTSTFSQASSIAHAGGQSLFVAWEEIGGYLLLFSRADVAAQTSSAPALVLPGTLDLSFGQARLASLGVDDVQVVVTSFNTFTGGAEIVHAVSSDAGLTFPDPKVISTIDGFNSVIPDIAAGWGVVAAWLDNDLAAESSIECSVSEDGGETFTIPKRLDISEGSKSSPAIGLDGNGSAYVAWVQNDDPLQTLTAAEIFFTLSTDRGATFSEPVNVSDDLDTSWPPRLAIDGRGVIYLLWPSGDFAVNQRLMLSSSADGGATFTEPQVVAGPTASIYGDIAAVGDGVVWLAWNESNEPGDPASYQGYVTRSVDGSLTFATPIPIPGATEIVAVAREEIFVTWHENPLGQGLPDVFVMRGEVVVCGDANVDGAVSATDALLALRAGVGSASCAVCRCDVDGSGGLTATDALLILNATVGRPLTLACEPF